MVRQNSQFDRVRRRGGRRQSIEKLAPQGCVQVAKDKVVAVSDADLVASLPEVRIGERSDQRAGPVLELLNEQMRRPASPGKGATANAEEQSGVAQRRVAVPRHAEVRGAA